MRHLLIAILGIALLSPLVYAGERGAEKLAEAEALAKNGKAVEAAALYGEELAAAQKKKDLAWQERVAKSIQDSLGGACAGGVDQRDAYPRSLQALMLALDPRRNYAFFSAGKLAHELLFEATRTGNTAYVEEAAKVCAKHAKISKVGPFAGAMVDYATGLRAVAAGEHASAIGALQKALAVTSTEGWAEPTVYIATELAAAGVAADQEDAAAQALDKAGTALKDCGDRAVAQHFRTIAMARLEGAPEKVLAAYETAWEPFSGGGSVSAAGGAGGAGGAAGGRNVSKIGAAWKKLSGKKPFVTARRSDGGYVIRESFDKNFEAEQPAESGVKHHDDGGITLSFWDGGVRLYMVDMRGLNGQPGESSERRSFEFFDPVARGYVWGVTKDGTVTQTRGR